ncbi:phosphatidic acid phosphatase type 2/haloperoxidase [Schizophyllum amplum]|uniref:Phosphatidic acid phosphatase type 2/haloperoxidase n=1 Tax=Schizophyllum amplum TaxID=97359 RepID=A0A550BZJ6_9AGAR|nr:phosphatidic acid phosphatase type 2/haloperoxidase [Auriculariopsis ampla]
MMAAVGLKRRSFMDIHHGTLALASSRGLTAFVTEFVKHLVGRLRPDFMSRCQWDAVATACTGKLSAIEEGRKSFPSGHSSTAFSGMMLLSLWIAGQTGAWCFTGPPPAMSVLSSHMLRFFLAMLPLIWATWVAISRLEDYRHHKEDIIVGSLLGIGFATISYLMYWPSPLLAEGAHLPRMLYHDDGRREQDHFQLYGVEGDIDIDNTT